MYDTKIDPKSPSQHNYENNELMRMLVKEDVRGLLDHILSPKSESFKGMFIIVVFNLLFHY